MRPSLVILSDPICPWCYIGKRRLDQAGRQRRDPFRRLWRPFQLNPAMPPEGMDRQEYLERKFGGKENAARVYGAIAEAAAETGLTLRFDRIRRTPNTLDAHRLLAFAGDSDAAAEDHAAVGGAQDRLAQNHDAQDRSAQDRVAEILFRLYFEEGEDISDRATLSRAAGEAGLDPEAAAAHLAGEADVRRVREQDSAARAAGVSGAPTFIIGERDVAPGALPSAVWLRIFEAVDPADDPGAAG